MHKSRLTDLSGLLEETFARESKIEVKDTYLILKECLETKPKNR